MNRFGIYKLKKQILFLFVIFSPTSFAEVEFAKINIKLGPYSLSVEVAESDPQRAQGLMFRKKLDEYQGMLFVFEKPQTLSFWMKNTEIPLSIGFFDSQLKLFDIHDMNPVSVLEKEMPKYVSRGRALLALEVQQGWFKNKNIKRGTRLHIENQKGKEIPTLLRSILSRQKSLSKINK
ncbi:MAG: DUF192 domain-containing protein [Bdellovibrionales bacterium]|nr:DUF192 domain-containing protein [Bdellovibrionales bacterium]